MIVNCSEICEKQVYTDTPCSYHESEDSVKFVVIGLRIVKLHWCRKVTHHKSMVKSVHKGRWLHLQVNSYHCKVLRYGCVENVPTNQSNS